MNLLLSLALVVVAACAVEPADTATSQQDLQTACDPTTDNCAGGGGGGWGGSGSCATLNCSADWQCQQACLSPTAVCLVVTNFPATSGSCWP